MEICSGMRSIRNRPSWLRWSIVLPIAVLVIAICARSAVSVQPPNIVIILADDLGARDLACDGADYHETPHLDRLASNGVRFTQAYAPAPICSPTRASILTGKSPARLKITIWAEGSLKGPTNRKLLQAKSQHDLPHTETTLAKLLQSAGYLTAAIGKWHLGGAAHYPETHGFDIGIGGTHWGAPHTYFFPYRGIGRFGIEFRYVPHLEFGESSEYLTDRLTDEALKVIDYAAEKKKPLFLYLAHYAPHTPIEAKPDDIKFFEAKSRSDLKHRNPVYAAMIKSLDENVGRVVSRLNERGLDSNTLVIFTSDNGGYIGTDRSQSIPVTSNAPLRSGKGTLYEGGLRVPLLIRYPGVAQTSAVCDHPVILTDLFPTVLHVAGVSTQPDFSSDGLDLSPLLVDTQAKLERQELYFHYPHYYFAPDSTPASALRSGNWKLIEYFEDNHKELFDLDSDPFEQHDRAVQMPDKVTELSSRLAQWRQSVEAEFPTKNPNFKPIGNQ